MEKPNQAPLLTREQMLAASRARKEQDLKEFEELTRQIMQGNSEAFKSELSSIMQRELVTTQDALDQQERRATLRRKEIAGEIVKEIRDAASVAAERIKSAGQMQTSELMMQLQQRQSNIEQLQTQLLTSAVQQLISKLDACQQNEQRQIEQVKLQVIEKQDSQGEKLLGQMRLIMSAQEDAAKAEEERLRLAARRKRRLTLLCVLAIGALLWPSYWFLVLRPRQKAAAELQAQSETIETIRRQNQQANQELLKASQERIAELQAKDALSQKLYESRLELMKKEEEISKLRNAAGEPTAPILKSP
jgi:hypothetical protein